MFQFTDDCLIGIDSLDDDHRYLFELINRVLELLKEEPTAERQTQVNAILDKLTAYADHHFIKEEEYMGRSVTRSFSNNVHSMSSSVRN